MVPNQIPAGSQNVDITLQGVNFVPGTQVTFTVGAGVPAAVFAAGPARYVNSTELHVTVSALPSALPGGRDINLQTPSQQSVVGKGMLNVQAVKTAGLPTVLKIPPITLQSFPMGVIKLDGPVGVGQCVADSGCTYAVPLLDDDAVFKWHEQNPGLADYYELRIYAKDGKTLLHTQKDHRNRHTRDGRQRKRQKCSDVLSSGCGFSVGGAEPSEVACADHFACEYSFAVQLDAVEHGEQARSVCELFRHFTNRGCDGFRSSAGPQRPQLATGEWRLAI